MNISLSVLPYDLAVCRLDKESEFPKWAKNSEFLSVSKTNDELSVVCEEKYVPDGVRAEKNWKIIKVLGPLDFSLTGVLSSIIKPLADNQISIFALSTFDTDYVLVKKEKFDSAIQILGKHFQIN